MKVGSRACRDLFFSKGTEVSGAPDAYQCCPVHCLKNSLIFTDYFSPHKQAQQKGVSHKKIYTMTSSKMKISKSTSVWLVEEFWGSFCWIFLFCNIFILYRKCLFSNLGPCGDRIPAPALHFNMPVSSRWETWNVLASAVPLERGGGVSGVLNPFRFAQNKCMGTEHPQQQSFL